MTLPRACPERLRRHVEALEGERHPSSSPGRLEAALDYAVSEMERLGLSARLEPFRFQGDTHHNAVARLEGSDPDAPRLLVGAHADTVRGSPGADDNASGVAGVLECARLLAGAGAAGDASGGVPSAGDASGGTPPAGVPTSPFRCGIDFAVFNLEEQQLYTYRVGSRRFTAAARKGGVEYRGAIVFEMIGYTSSEPGSQRIPAFIRWKDVPRTGDFLAVVGDWKSARLIVDFERAAARAAPDLEVFTHRTPLRGWIVWQTRLSDNASFWSDGYPALMVTDTAFLRNPHYHTEGDCARTLDYDFMAGVVDATAETVRALAGPRE